MSTIDFGKKGEIEAQKYLEKKGYFIYAKNFKCAFGEIDIIAIDENELVFVEVKTRCSKKYGEAREAVNNIKKKHIKKATKFFVYKNKFEDKFIRFDVIEVYYKNEKFYFKHIKNTLW